MHRRSSNFVENSESTKADNGKIEEKLLQLDRSITALERQIAKCKPREEEKRKQQRKKYEETSIDDRRSWQEISSQEQGRNPHGS